MKALIEAKKLGQILARRQDIKLKDALELVAKENQCDSWKDYKSSLDTFWYKKSSPFLTHWFTVHNEAVNFREREGGYLLTYKGQYFVVDRDYIEFLGLDPDAPVWQVIQYDVSPSNHLEKIYDYLKRIPGLID